MKYYKRRPYVVEAIQYTGDPKTIEMIENFLPDEADVISEAAVELRRLLTFDDLPSRNDLISRAEAIAELAVSILLDEEFQGSDPLTAMIGGAPYLMRPLEDALSAREICPVYAFSRREVVEEHAPDGTVQKKVVFRHLGFVAGLMRDINYAPATPIEESIARFVAWYKDHYGY